MYSDEIISEVWRNRETYGEQHNHDLDLMIADLMRRQEISINEIVDRRKQTESTLLTDTSNK